MPGTCQACIPTDAVSLPLNSLYDRSLACFGPFKPVLWYYARLVSAAQHYHLHGLAVEESENPHGHNIKPQQQYNIRDVAKKALEINGPSGENLTLRKARTDTEQAAADVRAQIAAKQAAPAAKFDPKTAADKICKRAGVVPDTKLCKKDVMAKFNLEWRELQDLGVTFEKRRNPRNPSWSPMQMFRAGDVANALAKQRRASKELMRAYKEAQARRVAKREADLQVKRSAQAAAAAIEQAGEKWVAKGWHARHESSSVRVCVVCAQAAPAFVVCGVCGWGQGGGHDQGGGRRRRHRPIIMHDAVRQCVPCVSVLLLHLSSVTVSA